MLPEDTEKNASFIKNSKSTPLLRWNSSPSSQNLPHSSSTTFPTTKNTNWAIKRNPLNRYNRVGILKNSEKPSDFGKNIVRNNVFCENNSEIEPEIAAMSLASLYQSGENLDSEMDTEK